MSALVSEKFHVHSARQFVESFSETANDVYYMVIGRPTPWPTSDLTPSTPVDSVEMTTFDYWRDVIALKRVTSDHLMPVVPRYNWTANGQYSMYDHRISQTTAVANTEYPFYVMSDDLSVFKCIYNGRSNSTSGPSNSVSSPSITGQVDLTATTPSSGLPQNYVWKYLYTVSTADALMYLTSGYIPVRSSDYALDANGAVLDDLTDQYTVFHAARGTGNGSIYYVVVETPGSGYLNVPTIEIVGDGSGARAVAVVQSGQLTGINLTSGGVDYSRATVVITPAGEDLDATGATATAIISPRSAYVNSTGTNYVTNHAINLEEELTAKYVMLHLEWTGTESGAVSTGNDYRRVGLVRNPVLYGTATRATDTVYRQTTDLTVIAPSGSFLNDEIVWQKSSNAYGVVVEQDASTLKLVGVNGTFTTTGNTYILGIGNGDVAGQGALPTTIIIPSTPEPFTPTVMASGASATVTAITPPAIQPYSGTILYVDHRAPITRTNTQTEILRTILTF